MKGILLPLKQTQTVDYVKPFEKHIEKKFSKQAAAGSKAAFETMQKLRNSLDFSKMQAQLNNDYRLAPDFQAQIIQYLPYVYLVDNIFRNDFNDSKYLKMNFTWTDSLQTTKKTKSMDHIKYELASCLYNLALCYYIEGIHLIASPNAQDKLKGTPKLRSALWCVNEIKQILPSLLAKPNDIPSDLNLSYMNLLSNYFVGLTFAALAEVLGTDTKKNGPEKLASVNKAAAKHFQVAFEIISSLKPCPLPDQLAKALRINLLYNSIMFRSEAYYQIAQIHIQKVDDEILAGHMGYATSYLRISKNDFAQILDKKSDLDMLSFDQKSSLMEKAKLINSNYDNCALKNSRVYKQQEFTAEQLPEISEEKTQITALEPKDIKRKLEEEKQFEGFLSPEIVALKNEFQNFVGAKRIEIENALKNANNVKNKFYSESYVNYLLDIESQSGDKKLEIPAQLKTKIDKFKKNGGVTSYAFTKKNIGETSTNCMKMFDEIKRLLAKEKDEDEQYRKQFPSTWNRAYSEQVNQEYVFKLRDLEQKFFIAQNTDTDINKKFDQYNDWMQKFSMPDEQILKLIPRNSENEFISKNKNGLNELVALNKTIDNLIDLEKQRNFLEGLTEDFMKSDFISSFTAINTKQANKQAEFERILGPYQAKLDQISNQIQEAYPYIDTISNKAKAINATRSQNDQSAVKILEEMSLAITVINDIYNDFQQGLQFYTNLSFHLHTLQKIVSDYCLAREMEKNALVQELQANQNANNFNNQNPFFKEDSMQFPEGKSFFVPQNQPQNAYPQYPQQQGNQGFNQNPQQGFPQNQQGGQGGYTQTQMYSQNPNQHYIPQQQGGYQQSQHGYNPNQAQQHLPPQQGQGQNQQGFYGNTAVSQGGYMPLNNPEAPSGQFGNFGNIVESTFIPNPSQGNPYGNQGKGPGHY